MKIKEGFVLREVAGDIVVLPSGDMNLNAMITLNESGAFLWRKLEKEITEEELIQAVLAEYKDVDADTAKLAVEGFVNQLKVNDFLA